MTLSHEKHQGSGRAWIMLLLAGADPNRDVINPLLVAIRHGCLRTMQLLLDHGANIDAYIATHPTSFPATIMFAMKCLSLLKFLMDLGCNGEPCFSCLYGNGPHPPAPPPSNRFNDAPASDKAPSAVQVGGRAAGTAARPSGLPRPRGLEAGGTLGRVDCTWEAAGDGGEQDLEAVWTNG